MLRANNSKWYKMRYEVIFPYDWDESYWVVDEEGFQKNSKSKCALSTPTPGNAVERVTKMVPCTEWHFYLCAKDFRPIKTRDYKLPYQIIKCKFVITINIRIHTFAYYTVFLIQALMLHGI